MVLDKQHLREISQNAFQWLTNLPLAIGPVVPDNKKRFIYFCKIVSVYAVSKTAVLYRDGSSGTSVLDSIPLPSIGTGGIGKPYLTFGSRIDMPVYVLEEGEQLGGKLIIPAPATAGCVFISYYDE